MTSDETFKKNTIGFLKGNDTCTRLIHSIDWAQTSAGTISDWPQSLKTTLNIILNAKIPMFLFWGPERIQFFNDAFLSVFGPDSNLSGELGIPGRGSMWIDCIFVKELIDEVFITGSAALTDNKQINFYRNNQFQNVCLSCNYTPLIDETDDICGIFITCFEVKGKDIYQKDPDHCRETRISEMMKTHLAVFNAEERLRLATEATGIGSWDIDLPENTIIYTPTLMELFGLDRDAIVNLEEMNSIIHPDDKDIVDKALADSLITGYYHYEARLFWPDESVHWIKTNGRVIFDSLNNPTRLLGTTVDITEHKTEQLQKNDFLAIASHELKTPLTSIKAYLQMLKSGHGLADPYYVINIASRAENQVIKMTKLIYSFLDMSRIKSGNVDLCMESFMMDELINEVLKDYLIHTNTHILNFTPGITEMIEGDRTRIGQVIDNLVSNAIKYSPFNKIIEISSIIFDDEAIVSVKDYGIGIDPKHQEKVFERFYRADDQKARNAAGFGIGLYLSADILKRHNGGIWIESDGDIGTTFHFSLPLTRS